MYQLTIFILAILLFHLFTAVLKRTFSKISSHDRLRYILTIFGVFAHTFSFLDTLLVNGRLLLRLKVIFNCNEVTYVGLSVYRLLC